LDTSQLVSLAVIVASVFLLIVISAAEAGVAAISRARAGAHARNGLAALLDRYIQQRVRILRVLSVASTATVVAGTAATLVLVANGKPLDGPSALIAAAIAILAASTLRQTARGLARINPESTGLRLARSIRVLQVIFSPLAWVAATPVRVVLRATGQPERDEPDPAAELLAVLSSHSGAAGDELSEERRMMRGVLSMSEQTVRELMSPRIDITAVSTDASIGDVLRLITQSGFSRIPLYRGSIDHVVGVLYAKDLLAYLQTGDVRPNLEQIARPPYFVPETKRADELLADLRHHQVHMAIVVDEYGGTAGVITVEDLLEEIVGEIADEYDTSEVDVQQIADGEAVVDARLPIDDLNELFETTIDSEDFDTVGGLIFSLLGRLAVPGDIVVNEEQRLRLQVISILGRRIKKVRITRVSKDEEDAEAS